MSLIVRTVAVTGELGCAVAANEVSDVALSRFVAELDDTSGAEGATLNVSVMMVVVLAATCNEPVIEVVAPAELVGRFLVLKSMRYSAIFTTIVQSICSLYHSSEFSHI